MGKGAKDVLLARFTELGIVQPVGAKVFGLFPTTKWPAVDRSHEASVRSLLHGAWAAKAVKDAVAAAQAAMMAAVVASTTVATTGN